MQCLRWPAVLGAMFLVLSVCTSARAESDGDVKQKASEHFDRGVGLYKDGNLDAALVELERAYELVPNYRLLYNLGQLQADRHDYAAAVALYERYLEAGGQDIAEERRTQTQDELALLRQRIAELWVECNVPGAQLFINDVASGTLPMSVPMTVNAGVLQLRLEAPGYSPTQQRLKVAGGERPRVVLALAASSGESHGTPSNGRAYSTNYTPLSISAASAVVFGGAAIGFGFAAHEASSGLDTALGRFPADKNEVDTARSRLKLYSAVTVGTAATSLVALGLVVYFLLDPPRGAPLAQRSQRRPAVSVLPSREGLGLSVQF